MSGTQTWTNVQRRAAIFASKRVSTQPEVINVPVMTASNSKTMGDLANVYIMFRENLHLTYLMLVLRRATSFVVDNYLLVRLELVPELQTLLINYESMSKRLAVLEQVKSEPPIHQRSCTFFSFTTRFRSHSRFAFVVMAGAPSE